MRLSTTAVHPRARVSPWRLGDGEPPSRARHDRSLERASAHLAQVLEGSIDNDGEPVHLAARTLEVSPQRR